MKTTDIYKILSEGTINEMDHDDYIADAKEAVDKFNSEMAKIFPEQKFKSIARVANIVGEVVAITFLDRKWKVTRHNATIQFEAMMHFDGRKGPMEKFSIESTIHSRELTKAGVKYRKISGKTPSQAFDKLLKWFKKNSKAIIDLEATLEDKS